MSLISRKGRFKASIKRLGPSITCLSFLFILSCYNGTSSTTSSSGSSGTGVGWNISVLLSKNSVSSSGSEAVGVNVIVRDSGGAAALKGTQICITVSRGGLVTGTNTVVANKCDTTSTDNGQVTETYKPAAIVQTTTVDSSTGTSTTTTSQAPIRPGPDTITASSMGVFGSATINVTP
jgi:hypothetical protein